MVAGKHCLLDTCDVVEADGPRIVRAVPAGPSPPPHSVRTVAVEHVAD
jgi:hypothetical protein